MFDVFKYLSDLEARAHMLEGTINPKTGKLYTKEQIARTLGIMDPGGNLATDLVLRPTETPRKHEKEPKVNNIGWIDGNHGDGGDEDKENE